MSCVLTCERKSHRLLGLYVALLLILSSVAQAGSLAHQGPGDAFTTVFDQYNTGNPIAVGQVTAIGGTQVTRPTCALIIAGTHLPTSSEGLKDWPNSFLAGVPQDLVTGLNLKVLRGNPSGFDNFTLGIKDALKREQKGYCPNGADLVVFAHSLGCMEFQRLVASGALQEFNLNLIEADLAGCPQLKSLSAADKSVMQFYGMAHDPLPFIGLLLKPLTQDWENPGNLTPIPFTPNSSGVCGQVEAHLAYPGIRGPQYRLTTQGDGSKSIDLDHRHPYPAFPSANADNNCSTLLCGTVEYTRILNQACELKAGVDEIKRIQRQNNGLPPLPQVSH